ncbi:hypothetical protein HHL11_10120 [Ramlibacter sp. G-1-2-2]|uniref:Uncharacterized protein n=1 Tax=Ramlibacter agri TaxID=2728837 RepID=A0A848GZW6_9BURK|nr:hypothetical protein [Ramlibacter agri]NML44105.1 hypothetical protein [Ramlibacter agri]
MQTETPKFQAWFAAEKEAREAERKLHAQMLQFARGTSAAPLADVVLLARSKRAMAHALFDEAMQELDAIARSLHHRQLFPTGASLLKSASAQHPASSDDSSSHPFQDSR